MDTPQPSTPARRIAAWWPRIPRRALLGVAVALTAVAALAWQHHSDAAAKPHHEQRPAASAPASPAAGAPSDAAAPPVGQLAAADDHPDAASQDAAHATAQRFATNFGSPNGNRDDWLARICPDVSAQLAEQYRLTDIRNVTQADVTSVDGPVRQEPGTITFDVDYSDGSRIEIRLETGTEGWKVINVVPLTSNGVRPAPDDVTEQASQRPMCWNSHRRPRRPAERTAHDGPQRQDRARQGVPGGRRTDQSAVCHQRRRTQPPLRAG